ncbi:ABC transporter ATP-binding protein [Ruania alba]|uniref:ABC-2 type transport system ATP-binding protein n=1 Tax=Ruania alba TaxID=648782 RepID=A0A1H5D7Y9_9MICO|nr:ABC transporter ATP-binding protein [Ruania alba]SED74969.1 ABC-2 type transport system ATP-binding protein [Ruania alba]
MTADCAITTEGLRKTYPGVRRRVAVDRLDLRVPVGGVHGFLGPNGSGKTTTIRMLLGLIRPDEGEIRIFGRPVPAELPDVIGRVGAIVESPKFFPNFTGRQNLELLAGAIGARRRRVRHVIAQAGLADRADDRFGTYSLGMKQRLAIAATLLKEPDLLIFDEPTNGLDPAGIHEIRTTMRRLADEGHTVLVSSHILGEVEQIADTVSIIGRGRLIATGAVSDIIGQRAVTVRVVVPEPDTALPVLARAGLTARVDEGALLLDGADDPACVNRLLAEHGIYAAELGVVRVGLESVFLELTQEVELGRPRRRDRRPSTQAGAA